MFYEQRHAGSSLAFLAAVDVAVGSLVRSPRAGAPIEGLPDDLDVRRVPVSRFPYHLAYLVTDEQIHVLAIAHDRPTRLLERSSRAVTWSTIAVTSRRQEALADILTPVLRRPPEPRRRLCGRAILRCPLSAVLPSRGISSDIKSRCYWHAGGTPSPTHS